MDKPKIFLGSLCLALTLCGPSWAADDYTLSNAPTQLPDPQTVILLPSGQRIDPWVTLPDGWILSDDGSVINEDGLLIKKDGTIEYPFGTYPKGYVQKPDGTIVTPEGFTIRSKEAEAKRLAKLKGEVGQDPQKIAKIKDEAKVKLPKGAKVLADGTVILPDGRKVTPKGQIIDPKVDPNKKPTVVTDPRTNPNVVVDPRKPTVIQQPTAGIDEPTQLWSMLPLTEVPGQKPKAEVKPKPQEKTKPTQEKPKPTQEKPLKKQEAKVEPKPTKPTPPKPEPRKETPKPRIGEYLHIPPEAIKNGNLDFLEGCWQGTRPEYYTKRTIYECFCFGKQGAGGKRKVIDPSGGRRCVGSTSANLSASGVLNVSSSGAVCSDGERWGQAQMTCRGKGQHTPCSWVFKDANGGRQAYEIPFVRVQACGRRR